VHLFLASLLQFLLKQGLLLKLQLALLDQLFEIEFLVEQVFLCLFPLGCYVLKSFYSGAHEIVY